MRRSANSFAASIKSSWVVPLRHTSPISFAFSAPTRLPGHEHLHRVSPVDPLGQPDGTDDRGNPDRGSGVAERGSFAPARTKSHQVARVSP